MSNMPPLISCLAPAGSLSSTALAAAGTCTSPSVPYNPPAEQHLLNAQRPMFNS
jgi:hypothetical protein